jgi:hypothetical protein
MCTVLLSPGVNPVAVNKYIISYICLLPCAIRPFEIFFYSTFSDNCLFYSDFSISIVYIPLIRQIDLKNPSNTEKFCRSGYGMTTLCAVCVLGLTLLHCDVGFGMLLLLIIDKCFEFDERQLCSNSSVIN